MQKLNKLDTEASFNLIGICISYLCCKDLCRLSYGYLGNQLYKNRRRRLMENENLKFAYCNSTVSTPIQMEERECNPFV